MVSASPPPTDTTPESAAAASAQQQQITGSSAQTVLPAGQNLTADDTSTYGVVSLAPTPAPALAPAPAPAPGVSPSLRHSRRRPPSGVVLGGISNFTQPKLGSSDLDKLLAANDAAYSRKIGQYSDVQNATWHQGDPDDNSGYGYYNGTQLPGAYPDGFQGRRKLLASTVPYTAAVQATLLANNTPQVNIIIQGDARPHKLCVFLVSIAAAQI